MRKSVGAPVQSSIWPNYLAVVRRKPNAKSIGTVTSRGRVPKTCRSVRIRFLVSTERSITRKGLDESATQLIPALSTVIVARGATTGRMVLFGNVMAMNQTCYALASIANTPFALNCLLKREIGDLLQTAHGSVFDTITTSTFGNWKVSIPPLHKLMKFEDFVSPLFSRMLANVNESRTLINIRDSILPQLLSGQIRLPCANFPAGCQS